MAFPTISSASFAAELVKSEVSTALVQAFEAYETGLDALEALTDAVGNLTIPVINVDLSNLPNSPAAPSLPDAPDAPAIAIPVIAMPDSPDLTLSTQNYPGAPSAILTSPNVQLPIQPTFTFADAPLEPTVDTDVDLPDSPDNTLPDVPSLRSLSLPSSPTITLPEFLAIAPTLDGIEIPTLETYDVIPRDLSACFEEVQTILCNIIQNGGMLMNASIEANIWGRERDREQQLAAKAEAEVHNDMASRGFSLPNGTLMTRLLEVRQDSQNKLHSISRDVAIKQAELEHDSIKYAVDQYKEYERISFQQWLDITNVTIEQYKYANQIALDIYNSQVRQLELDIELYKTAALVYETVLRGELAKLEIYKAQLDAQRLIGDINTQEIQLYSAQIDAVKSKAELYRIELDGVRIVLEAERTKVDIYKTQVDAYGAQFSAAQAEASIYSAMIDGELSKVKIYEAEADVYSTQVQAYATEVNSLVTQGQLSLGQQEAKVSMYNARVNAAGIEAQVAASITNTTVDLFTAQKEIYTSTTSVNQSHYLALIEAYKAEIAKITSEGQLLLQAEIGSAEVTMKGQDALISGLAGTAQAAAQLATAAMSAINLSASIGDSSSTSYTHSASYDGGNA